MMLANDIFREVDIRHGHRNFQHLVKKSSEYHARAFVARPADIGNLRNFGKLKEFCLEFERALLLFKRVILLNPLDIEGNERFFLTLHKTTQYETAINWFRFCKIILKANFINRFVLANCVIKKGNKELGVKLLRQSVLLDPSWPTSYHNLALVYQEIGQIHSSLLCFSLYIRRNLDCKIILTHHIPIWPFVYNIQYNNILIKFSIVSFSSNY